MEANVGTDSLVIQANTIGGGVPATVSKSVENKANYIYNLGDIKYKSAYDNYGNVPVVVDNKYYFTESPLYIDFELEMSYIASGTFTSGYTISPTNNIITNGWTTHIIVDEDKAYAYAPNGFGGSRVAFEYDKIIGSYPFDVMFSYHVYGESKSLTLHIVRGQAPTVTPVVSVYANQKGYESNDETTLKTTLRGGQELTNTGSETIGMYSATQNYVKCMFTQNNATYVQIPSQLKSWFPDGLFAIASLAATGDITTMWQRFDEYDYFDQDIPISTIPNAVVLMTAKKNTAFMFAVIFKNSISEANCTAQFSGNSTVTPTPTPTPTPTT